MRWTWARVTLAIVDGFAALSAIGGGFALMAGMIVPITSLATGRFSWLISDYFVAGEILALVTGGTALVALVATLFSRTAGAGFSAAAGLVMIGWIVSEVLIIAGIHWLHAVYAATGLAMVVLAVLADPADGRTTAHRLHVV